MWQQSWLLKEIPNGAPMGRPLSHIRAPNHNLPAIHRLQPSHRPQQCRLAGARGAKNTVTPAGAVAWISSVKRPRFK